jgi:hypothetical protein
VPDFDFCRRDVLKKTLLVGTAGLCSSILPAVRVLASDLRVGFVYVGAIRDNTSKLVIPAGTSHGPYSAELQKTDHLVEGVIGSVN